MRTSSLRDRSGDPASPPGTRAFQPCTPLAALGTDLTPSLCVFAQAALAVMHLIHVEHKFLQEKFQQCDVDGSKGE